MNAIRDIRILKHRFYAFLFPSVLSMLALSLNEFLDSIIVAKLLGSDAMALVNLCSPVIFVFGTVLTLLGTGGSIEYARHLGNLDRKMAGMYFSVSLLTAVLLSVFFIAAGLAFMDPIGSLLCPESSRLAEFLPYLRITFLSAPFIIVLQVIIAFLPASDRAVLASALNIIPNVINLILDVVFIRYTDLGVAGAALATLCGYLCGLLVLLLAVLMGKIPIHMSFHPGNYFHCLGEIIRRGAASSLVQLGFCIRVSFVNNLASGLGGIAAVSVFSACLQSTSMLSVIVAGILESYVPLIAMLYSQEDWTGIRLLMRYVMKIQLVINIIFTGFVELFPVQILSLFNVTDPTGIRAGTTALRIFAITFLFRAFYLFYKSYFQVIDRKMYAALICLIEGCLASCPIAWLMAHFWGLNGLWASFPIVAVLVLGGILLVNMYISRHSEGQYYGVLLIKKVSKEVRMYECTFTGDNNEVVRESSAIQAFFIENQVQKKSAAIVALACEEIGVYTVNSQGKHNSTIDIIIRIMPETIIMIFRSEGLPFNWMRDLEQQAGNVWTLEKIADECTYDYVMGMNQTRLRILSDG